MSENEVFYILDILQENHSSCSMLKIFQKYLNFESISKICIRIPGPKSVKTGINYFIRTYMEYLQEKNKSMFYNAALIDN